MSLQQDPGAAAARLSPSTRVGVLNEKGGSGKTMLTLALAQHTAAAAGRALVVDTDGQASSHDLTAAMTDPGYDVVAERDPATLSRIGELREHDSIYVDTPGHRENVPFLRRLLEHLDFVIIPYDHEPESILPTVRTLQLVIASGVPYGVAVTKMPGGQPGREVYADAARTIQTAGGVVLRSFIRRYRAWPNSLRAGVPLTRWREGNASALREDVARVHTEVLLNTRRTAA